MQCKSNMLECGQYLSDAGVCEISEWAKGIKINVRPTRLQIRPLNYKVGA